MLDKIINGSYERGWEIGHSVGYEDGTSDGVMVHKEMIRNRINMHIETCMNTNKYREAQFAKEMLEYLMWEYDPSKVENDEETYGIIL